MVYSEDEVERLAVEYEKSFEKDGVKPVGSGLDAQVLERGFEGLPEVKVSVGEVVSLNNPSQNLVRWGIFRVGNFEYELAGHGEATNEKCGKFVSLWGCLRTELHSQVGLDGFSHKGEVFVRLGHHSCNNFRCKICYKYGASSRASGKIEQRLLACSKFLAGMGKDSEVFHVILSVPPKDYGLPFKELKAKGIKALRARGIYSFVLVFHPARYHNYEEYLRSGTSNELNWFYSPHWHLAAFIEKGYARCRSCPEFRRYGSKSRTRFGSPACVGCSGFEGVTRREYENDGYICKVEPKRVSVRRTVFYELGHAGLLRGVKRFSPYCYVGVLASRKLKVVVEKPENRCPLCLHELIRVRYFGIRKIITDLTNPKFLKSFWLPMVEDGVEVLIARSTGDFG